MWARGAGSLGGLREVTRQKSRGRKISRIRREIWEPATRCTVKRTRHLVLEEAMRTVTVYSVYCTPNSAHCSVHYCSLADSL